MAVLGDRNVVVGSVGQFCDFAQALDASGGTVWSLYDLDHSDFGRVVATIGRDVLVTHLGTSGYEVLRIEPVTAAVRATLPAPEPVSSSIDALVAVNQRVALLDTGVRPGEEPSTCSTLGAEPWCGRCRIRNPGAC